MRPILIILASTVLQLLVMRGGAALSAYMFDQDLSTSEVELVPVTTGPALSP